MLGGGRRIMRHGDNIRRGDTGHWSEGAIITALQGYNHQANVSPCLLSPPSCNMQTADSLQTSCRLFDFRKIKERASQWISENYIFPLLTISLLHCWSREGTCLVTTCHMSWAEQGLDTGLHLSAVFITHYHYLSEILNIAHTQHQIVLNWTCFAKKVNILWIQMRRGLNDPMREPTLWTRSVWEAPC